MSERVYACPRCDEEFERIEDCREHIRECSAEFDHLKAVYARIHDGWQDADGTALREWRRSQNLTSHKPLQEKSHE